MKKYILTLMAAVTVCFMTLAQDFVVVNQGTAQYKYLIGEVNSITHSTDADTTVTINQDNKVTTYLVADVDSITFIMKGIYLNKHELVLDLNDEETLIATVLPLDAPNRDVVWTSSDPSVATVDENGNVVAVSSGTTIITATTIDGQCSDTCVVTVTNMYNFAVADIVMCIDVSGSMSDIINTVKNNALQFNTLFRNGCEANNIKLDSINTKVIAFNDLNTPMNVSDWFAIPEQETQFSNFINTLRASGGGASAENGLEAIYKAFNFMANKPDEKHHRQVIIVWTDEPYPIGSSAHVTYDQMKQAWDTRQSGMRLILFAPNGIAGYSPSKAAGWETLDSWEDVLHDTDLVSGFNDFDYILDTIIGDLIGREIAVRNSALPLTRPFVSDDTTEE